MKKKSELRREYTKSKLDIKSIHPNPLIQFEQWMNDAIKAEVIEPNAMTLSTVSKNGIPSSRIVLLRGMEHKQFIFYTNYQSQKGKDLENNPACSINFFWALLERQVIIKGITERVDSHISDTYFQGRPRQSQITAWTSPQSSIIENRGIIEKQMKKIEQRYATQKTIPRPKQWGGYEVIPYEIEFWQGRVGRMHDRIMYRKNDDKWEINRLAP